MHSEALVWLTTGIGGPLSVVWLCWAILVLWFGRGQWRPSDPLLVALLAEAIAKQAAGTAGSALSLFRPDEPALCSAVQWLWTAAHTMQAGTLASLALMAALRRKKRAVTAGGRPLLLYHLASLLAVSACVGAAALIAQTDPCAPPSDRRYAVFSLVLHACLAAVCAASAAFGCAGRRHKGPDPLLVNSSSDLSSCPSDTSTVSTCGRAGIRHSVSDCSDRTAATVTTTASAVAAYPRRTAADRGGLVHDLLRLPLSAGDAPPVTFLHGAPRALPSAQQRHQQRPHGPEDDCTLADTGTLMTCSDRDSYAASTIGPYRYGLPGSRYLPSTAASVSVTSTNSRAPCLARRVSLVQDVRIGYVAAILFMCYFVDHLPVLVLMASQHFFPSTFVLSADYAPVVKNFPMLAALAEACLWPVVLLLFDDQFVPRLSNLYRRRSASDRAKPPQGLHGKFRPYNGSLQDARRPTQTPNGGGEAVRFPITNGSLFASLDGRVPVLHNYRRGVRTMSGLLVPPPHFTHASTDPAGLVCCEDNGPHYHHHRHRHHHQQQQQQQPQQHEHEHEHERHHPHHHRSLRFANMVTASAAASTTDGGDCKPATVAAPADDGSSTPADSLDNAIVVTDGDRLPQNLQQLREKLYARHDEDDDYDDDGSGCGGGGPPATGLAEPTAGDSSSDDGCCDRRDDCCEDEDEYATLSARSACSATTAANDDFEYFAGGGAPSATAADASLPGRVPYRRAPTRRVRHRRDHPHRGHSPRSRRRQHDVQYVQQQCHRQRRQRRPASASPAAAPPTPPAGRRPKARLAPVLSVDSLVAAQLQQRRRDDGAPGRPQHHRGGVAGRRLGDGRGHHGGSVPDLQRVFVTDFL